MKRVKGISGIIHFRNPAAPSRCLCGAEAVSSVDGLFGTEREGFQETTEQVTCLNCAKVYAQVKDEPWRAIDRRVMMCGCLHAVGEDGPVASVPAVVDTILANAEAR